MSMSKKCKKCDYWCERTATCDYLLRAGMMRGCPIDDCIRFKPIQTNKRSTFVPSTRKKFNEPKSSKEHSRLDKNELMFLYEKGLTDAQIARASGSCRKSVWRWRMKSGLPSNSRKDDHEH